MPVTFGPARFRGNTARRARGRDIVDRFRHSISPDALSSSGRTVDALAKFSEPGGLPDLLADTMLESGEDSIGEIGEIFEQVSRRDPPMARKLFDRLESRLRQAPGIVKPVNRPLLRPAPVEGPIELADVFAGLEDMVEGQEAGTRSTQSKAGKVAGADQSQTPKPDGPGKGKPPEKPGEPRPDPCKEIENALNEVFDELLATRQEILKTKDELSKKRKELRDVLAARPGDTVPGTEHMIKPRESKIPMPSPPMRIPGRRGIPNPFTIGAGQFIEDSLQRHTTIALQRIREKEINTEIEALQQKIQTLRRQEENHEANVDELNRRLKACEATKTK